MNHRFATVASFPRRQVTITPSDTVDLARRMVIECGSAGTIAVHDEDGTAVTRTVSSGDILPIMARRVLLTGTTVTPVIGLYT